MGKLKGPHRAKLIKRPRPQASGVAKSPQATASAQRDGETKGAPPSEVINGAEAQSRTGDTSIFSAVLYQLSYLGTARSARQNPHNTRSFLAPSGVAG